MWEGSNSNCKKLSLDPRPVGFRVFRVLLRDKMLLKQHREATLTSFHSVVRPGTNFRASEIVSFNST